MALSPEYDADTDYESDSASTAQWPKLPDFFDGLVFALHEQLPAAVRQKLRRYIVSAKGCVQNSIQNIYKSFFFFFFDKVLFFKKEFITLYCVATIYC